MAQISRHTRLFTPRFFTPRLSASRGALCAGLCLATLAPQAAMAGGFYLAEQSTKGTGRAYSGEVADQGSESLWWNPAAIGGLVGGSANIGVSGILPSSHVDNNNTLIARPLQAPTAVGGDQSTRTPIDNGVLPTGAIAYGLTHRIAVGLALTSPYSFTTTYPSTSWTRYSAEKTRLRTYDIQPTLALMLAPGISVGAGINIEKVMATLSNALPNLSPLLPDGQQMLTGNGWDVGYSVGGQIRRGPVSFGISYKSAIKHHLDGQVQISGLQGLLASNNGVIHTSADFSTPWQLAFGARLAATKKLTLDAQITRYGWSEFNAITLGAPVNQAIPENYRNTWSYAVGADYDITPRWTVRAGVARDLTPVQNDQRDARVPDGNRWAFALGATHALSKAFKVDVGAQYLTVDSGPINRVTAAYAGTIVQTPILTDGEVDGSHVVVLSMGGRLSF